MRLDNQNEINIISKCFAIVAFFLMLVSCLAVIPSNASSAPGDIIFTGEMIVSKTKGSPGESATSMQYIPENSGLWWANVRGYGVFSIEIIIKDITDLNNVVVLLKEKLLLNGKRKPIVDGSQVFIESGRTYQMTAIPSGATGTYAVITGYIEISNMPPIASFTVSLRGLIAMVDASGSTDDGNITQYLWYWGDGTASTGMITSHTYYSIGMKTIILNVTDNGGLQGTASETVEIVDAPPVAVIGCSDTAYVNNFIAILGTESYDPDGWIVSYLWDFGDGSSATGNAAKHTFTAEGQYLVALTVTDDFGATNTATKVINVIPSSISNREVTWTISNMFEMYQSDWNYNRSGGITFETAGHHTSTDGMPTWFLMRDPQYGEKVLRNTYPHIFFCKQNAIMTTPDVDMGYIVWAPYRMTIVAKNVTDCSTKTDAIYVPDLDNMQSNDGWINMSWYGTYMTTNEIRSIRSGTHFANWLYGVPLASTPRSSMDDGYWYQLMGKIHYSKQAAMSYLGWDGTGDARTWFSANVNNLTSEWWDDWMVEGSTIYDIYTAYSFSEDIWWLQLKLDPQNSTDSELSVLCWSMSWGMDAQIVRYMEAANIIRNGPQGYMEDMYLNVSVGPSNSNTTLRGTVLYDLMAWASQKEKGFDAAWMLEAHHIDWCGNVGTHILYQSPFNPYDPDLTDLLRLSYSPLTTHFGKQVSYWHPPLEFDLEIGESIIIKLPLNDIIGIAPGVGTSDILDYAKYLELLGNCFGGQMSLGNGYPDMNSYYDPIENTMYLIGPIDFPPNLHPLNPNLLYTGTPMFVFKVT